MSPPTSEKCFLDSNTRASQQTTSCQNFFNNKTVKLSYSCMQNMKQIISSHNKTVLESTKTKEKQGKNLQLQGQKILPSQRLGPPKRSGIQGNCGTETLEKTRYIGITENEFKTRYNQHTSGFRLNHKKQPQI